MDFSFYSLKTTDEVLDELKTSVRGLTEKEAGARLRRLGFNEIKEKEAGLFGIFLRQFKSPFFYLLFIAALTAFLIGEAVNGALILFFVFINVFLGFFQEARAEKAVSLLKKYVPSKVRVRRGGVIKVIDKKFLVPGDAVLLEAGGIAPADLRILKEENLLVDESVLTGESEPVRKTVEALSKASAGIFEAQNILFAGTAVVSGETEGVVIATGKNTELGRITKAVAEIRRESVYEKNLLKFSRLILRIVVVTIVFVFLANLIIKGGENFFEFLIFCIALIVSIIPEALPVVVTFALSAGALRMARQNVVVKRLSAIEDLGDIEILCCDKTGTLTENKLRLFDVFSADKNKCLLYGLLASSYIKEEIESSRNPFDAAIFREAPEEIRRSLGKFKAIFEIPFDLYRLMSSSLVEGEESGPVLIVKGAPEAILKLCSHIEGSRSKEEIKKEFEKEGREGKRVLGVAYKKTAKKEISLTDEKDLTWLGFFSFYDPLKLTAKEAVELAQKLGVKIKIITGDAKEVAGRVAKEIGLIEEPEEVVIGETLNALSEEEFEKACRDYSVFARISPQTKYNIVKALQKDFEVGFLGEGVNDAPALKMSHLAIAVENAADVSREAADIILLKKDLKVIIEGIKNGRNVFANINKYIKCTLASNFGNFYSIAMISLLIPFLPMLPLQILLVNLMTDFPLIAIVSDGVDLEELEKPKMYQINKMISLIFFLGLASTIFDFIFFGYFYGRISPAILQTLWFIESIFTEIALIYSIRTSHFFLRARATPSLTLAGLSVFALAFTIWLPFSQFGKEAFGFAAPSFGHLAAVFFLIAAYFALSEIVKLVYFRRWRNNHVAAQ